MYGNVNMNTDRAVSIRPLRWVVCSLACGALLVAVTGCGGGADRPEGMPELSPATITVTYKGQPVEGATVTLAPTSGTYSAGAVTDASGKAVMKTNGTYDGVAPGDYMVSISKVEAIGGNTGESSSDPAAYAQAFEAAAAKPTHLIPEKYSAPSTSGLTLKVTEGTPVDETFELTD